MGVGSSGARGRRDPSVGNFRRIRGIRPARVKVENLCRNRRESCMEVVRGFHNNNFLFRQIDVEICEQMEG